MVEASVGVPVVGSFWSEISLMDSSGVEASVMGWVVEVGPSGWNGEAVGG